MLTVIGYNSNDLISFEYNVTYNLLIKTESYWKEQITYLTIILINSFQKATHSESQTQQRALFPSGI